ncbi:ABC transporter ATP-binding protein [Flindersiella endophytica]
MLRFAFRVAPGSAVFAILATVASSVATVGLTYLVGQVVGALPAYVQGEQTVLWPGLAALLATLVAGGLLPMVTDVTVRNVANEADRDLGLQVAGAVLRPRRIGHLEDPAIQDELERARGKYGFSPTAGIWGLSHLISARLTMLGSAALVGWLYSWWVALVLAVTTALVEAYGSRLAGSEQGTWFGRTEGQRHASYAFELGMAAAPKEIRVFGLADWLGTRYLAQLTAVFQPLWRLRNRNTLRSSAVYAVHVGVLVGAVVLAGRAGADGQLSLAALVSVVPAVLRVGMSEATAQATWVRRAQAALRTARSLPAAIADRHPDPLTGSESTAPPESAAIRFDNVGFRYPGQDHDVLHELDLELAPGEAVALVGANGAGKSTLVKLLAGCYQPTSGRILVGDVDLATLDPERLQAWQHRIAAIVQDFVRFPLSAGDNVALGAPSADRGGLTRVSERASIEDLVDRLGSGWETVLDKTFEGGTDLSGGEWQRIALARALFAVEAGAEVLVLDEPAAALDVRAEATLVDRYLELTAGVTSLIISHRFSVVRDAHRICVLEAGRIVEQGSHVELLAAGGRYATMFRLQAERYVGAADA